MGTKRYILVRKTSSIIELLLVLLMTLNLFLAQVAFSNYPRLRSNQTLMVLGLLILILISSNYHSLSAIKRFDFFIVIGPYLAIFALSLLQVVVFKSVPFDYIIRQNGYNLFPCILAFLIFDRFKERAVDLLWLSCIFNNIYYLILFLQKYGPLGLLRVFQISELEELSHVKTLEVNEVSFILGAILIYFIINYKPANRFKILVTAFFVIIGTKRILFAAVFASLLAFYFFKKFRKIFAVWAMGLCAIAFGWLFFVTSPYYELVAAALGINLMGRSFSGNGVYSVLLGEFTMSPLYFGHGFGYVSYVLYYNFVAGVIGTTGFHNDILKYYIDLGFIPFFAFIIYMAVGIPSLIKKKVSSEAALQYLALFTMTLISWTTDNLASYPNYMMASFMLYYLAINSKKEKVVLNENSNSNGL